MFASFIVYFYFFVSPAWPVYTLKHILHLKYISTYTTAILKELWETVRILSSLDIYNFKTISKNIYMSLAMRKTVIEISLIVKL